MTHRLLLLFGLLAISGPLMAQSSDSDIEWIVWQDNVLPHYNIAVSPDGKRIATTSLISSPGASQAPDIRIYSAEEGELDRGGELLYTITNQQIHDPYPAKYGYLGSFGFLGNTSLFASFTYVDTNTGTPETVFLRTDLSGERIEELHRVSKAASSLFGAGFLMYYGDAAGDSSHIIGLDLQENRQRTFTNRYPVAGNGYMKQVAISGDGSTVALQQGMKYWLVETATGTVVGEAEYYGSWRHAMFLPDNRSVGFIGGDNILRVMDFQTGTVDRRIISSDLYDSYNLQPTISPDGRYLAAARAEGTIHLWNLRTGEKVYVYDEYQGYFTDIEFTPDGGHLITTTADGALISWKGPDKVAGIKEREEASGLQLSCTPLFNPATGTVRFNCRLPERSEVHVDLYNLQGDHVGELAGIPMEAGEREIEWNPGNIPSGIYFYRMMAGQRFATGRIALQF